MERHELLEAIDKLKLHGMRASFDEITGKGLQRSEELYPLLASLLRAEHNHRQARSIVYRIASAKFPVLKDLDAFALRRHGDRRRQGARDRHRHVPGR